MSPVADNQSADSALMPDIWDYSLASRGADFEDGLRIRLTVA